MIDKNAKGVNPLNDTHRPVNPFDPRSLYYPASGLRRIDAGDCLYFSTLSDADIEMLLKSCVVQVTPKLNPDDVRHIENVHELKDYIKEIRNKRKTTLEHIAELKKEIERLEKML